MPNSNQTCLTTTPSNNLWLNLSKRTNNCEFRLSDSSKRRRTQISTRINSERSMIMEESTLQISTIWCRNTKITRRTGVKAMRTMSAAVTTSTVAEATIQVTGRQPTTLLTTPNAIHLPIPYSRSKTTSQERTTTRPFYPTFVQPTWTPIDWIILSFRFVDWLCLRAKSLSK